MVTPNSTVYYKRSIMGSFTVKVTVLAEWEEAEGKGIMQKTGDFTGTMKLQGGSRGRGVCVWRAGCRFSAAGSPAAGPLVQGTRHGGLCLCLAPRGGKHGNRLSLAFFGKRSAPPARAWEPRDICPSPPAFTGPSAFQKPFEASRWWGPLMCRPSSR